MDETEQQRVNRELIELLNELRLALPGAQVLFGFLLAVPFQQGFARVSSFQRDAYFATLCATGLSLALLIAPSAVHRLNFRRHDKARIVRTGGRLAICGLFALAASMTGVMLLISELLFGETAAVIATATTLAVLGIAWVGLPLAERRRL